MKLILASASPRRLDLLRQIGVEPDQVIPAHIDETERKGELPGPYAKRMALEKAEAVARQHPQAHVLAADTVVACGRRILPKAENEVQARECLKVLSGRQHRVYGGICLISPGQPPRLRVCDTKVRMVRLTPDDIESYIASEEWDGKAGGYAIQGMAERFVVSVNGSISNIIGLNLNITANLLKGAGIGIR